MTWSSLALEFCGLTLLALAMERHREQVFGHRFKPVVSMVPATAGWMLLALSMMPPVARHGVSIGLSVWAGELTVVAAAVLLLLTYVPRLIPSLLAAAAIAVSASSLLAR